MRRVTRLVVGGALLLGAAVAARLWVEHRVGPTIPLPTQWNQIDPAVAKLIREAAAKVADKPANAETWLDLGMVYHANRMVEFAKPCYERSLAIDGSAAQVWYLLALVQNNLTEFDQAAASVRRSIALEPSYSPAYWQLGYWLLEQGDLAQAQSAFGAAARRSDNAPAALVGLARVHLQRRENEQAADILGSLLERPRELGPNEGYVNYLLGIAQRRLGRAEDARLHLSRSEQNRPVQVAWHDPWLQSLALYQADMYAKVQAVHRLIDQRDYDGAIASLQTLHTEYPDNTSCLLLSAACYRELRRFDESLDILGKVRQQNPNSPAVHTQYAWTYLKQSQRTADQEAAAKLRAQGLEHVQQALRINPTLSDAHVARAQLLLAGGDLPGAVQGYVDAARLCGDEADWLMRAARLQCEAENWDEAGKALRQVVALAPNNGRAWYLLGIAQMKLGSIDDAKISLMKADRLLPQDSQVRAALEYARTQSGAKGQP